MNTSKQEAQKRLDAMQKEMDELRKIIEAPDKLKEIDWSKLPQDTLVKVNYGFNRYIRNVKPHHVTIYAGGANSLTTDGYKEVSNLITAKLIENPKFTVWEGGECPVPEGVMVEVILRAGDKGIQRAKALMWNHTWSMGDIIAYRIIGVAEGYTPFFKGREF